MLGLVRDIRSETSAYDAMPCRIVFLVELLLDVGGDVFFDVVSLQSLKVRKCRRLCEIEGASYQVGHVDCFVLHLVAHIGVLDDSLSVLLCHFINFI